MQNKTISLELDAIEKILDDLDFLVTSLDRLGSAQLPRQAELDWLDKFVTDGNVFARLAGIRKTICLALDAQLSREEVEAIEERAEQIEPWPLPKLAR